MEFKFYFIAIILSFSVLCWADNCADEPILLDEEFIGCCRGRPKYTSEPCIDVLLENDTFSEECLLDCMYREFEIYNGTEIDLVAVKTFLDAQITDANFNLMYNNAFEICSKFDNKTIEETFSFIKLNNNYECDVYPIYMDICVWYHTLANCPEDYATNDENCINKQTWVNECLLKS
ncbi:uncharacterized protein LOC135961442 [Calliphora vicina]|uniref:uncharacterized protein LOC135961442 n=1 Tax=Calliphora vicina TaxID=7373 RepID=UPI00325A7B08